MENNPPQLQQSIGSHSDDAPAKNQIITEDNFKLIVKESLLPDVNQLSSYMKTSILEGLSQQQVVTNQKWGQNKIPDRPPEPFWKIFLGTFKDPTLIILIIAAIVSIIIGSAIPAQRKHGGYIDGIAILVAVAVVSLVGSVNDYQKERQFRKLNAVKEARDITVLREGKLISLSVYSLVVGDIYVFEMGDQLAADGILVSHQLLKMDQSQITGESMAISKNAQKPWLVGGALVSEGSGKMIVTAVGIDTINGEAMLALQDDNDLETPLQTKLNALVKIVGYIGLISAVLTFIVLIAKFFIANLHQDTQNYAIWVNYLILAITIVVVAIPEGLPLAVTISLAFSMKKMLKDQCLVRKLQSCETCGSISIICSDKTGTLTMNQMRVVRIFTPNTSNDQIKQIMSAKKGVPADIYSALCQFNTSFNKVRLNGDTVLGSKTGGAFMLMSRDVYGCDYEQFVAGLVYNNDPEGAVVHQIDFTSDRKRSTMLIDLAKFSPPGSVKEQIQQIQSSGQYISVCRGASEIILNRCVSYIDPDSGAILPLTEELKNIMLAKIQEYAKQSYRTLIMGYKQMENITSDLDELEQDMESELIFQLLVGIQDPLRPGVPEAINQLKMGGIKTVMVTGDNYITAISIAKEANIIDQHVEDDRISNFAVTGEQVRKMSDEELDSILPTLAVVARCQPKDKYRVVQRFQIAGHVVAATGDGSNDAPQLKEADVGLAMGIAGTEVAKEASDIVIMDDNFCSILHAVEWGRTVLASVRKFIQFQLTVNVVALVIAFLGAAFLSESPLTAIQLLYVNLIMDSLGSLALATEGPTPNILQAPPVKRSASIITPGMLRNIIIQSVYQLLVLLIMLFEFPGNLICFTPTQVTGEKAIQYRYTSIYNFFIFAQIFNEFNSRRLNNELNVFDGLFKNILFIIIIVVTVALQILIMFTPGLRDIFNVYSCKQGATNCGGLIQYGIRWETWLINLGLAAASLVFHFFGRLIRLPKEFKHQEKALKNKKVKHIPEPSTPIKESKELIQVHSEKYLVTASIADSLISNNQVVLQPIGINKYQ
ncbi:Calcium-transporting ATPase [Spironucleus salmonicida]|uniref:Calcium-transporting ATPase n=1 Tax=Spironucleus salmonicida TaxID=348837 RepID=V6LQ95_9EUKA|nr:Calcium-transporting ATPase [Spironucleus salmonicida]|eukprot:EST46418.1 Plasma membrane calcium-transporting ATPase [Spironucleus salmonicida]